MKKELDTVKDKRGDMTQRSGDYPLKKASDADLAEYREPVAAVNPFFNFRYTYLEVSSHAGQARVKARETRFENGKLVSEECEGTLDQDAVYDMMIEAQHQFVNQVTALMQPFLAFAPFRLNGRSDN